MKNYQPTNELKPTRSPEPPSRNPFLIPSVNPPVKLSPSIISLSQDKHYDDDPESKKTLDRLLDRSPKLSKGATFYVIGLIYRHLGIEVGTPSK